MDRLPPGSARPGINSAGRFSAPVGLLHELCSSCRLGKITELIESWRFSRRGEGHRCRIVQTWSPDHSDSPKDDEDKNSRPTCSHSNSRSSNPMTTRMQLAKYLMMGIALGVTAVVTDVRAQRGTSRRVPMYRSRSTISPYVNLFGANTGGTNQYFAFVRPQLQQEQFNQMQQQQVAQLNQSVMMQQQMLLNSTNPYGTTADVVELGSLQLRPSPAAGTLGTPHASYLNYSHYYYYPLQSGAVVPPVR
jgi:hypothetical protein